MPDTPENRLAYPKPNSQAPGCGLTIAKIGVLFSLATGAAIALVILDNFIPELLAASGKKRHKIYLALLKLIIHKSVPERPGRSTLS